MISLENKNILVTGASSGIGRAVAQIAASLGANLILLGRNNERLKETFDSLNGNGHEYYSVDLTNYLKVEEFIRICTASKGYINGFVHSAGIEITKPFKASTPLLFKEVFEINVFAGFELARILSQKKTVSPAGASFVFISSVSALLGDSCKTIYCSSKSALSAGIKAMALELAAKNIRCNCVLPGYVDTEMVQKTFGSIPIEAKQKIINNHPLGIGKPEDIAFLVSFLISDRARWITGSEYVIDGGYSC